MSVNIIYSQLSTGRGMIFPQLVEPETSSFT